MSLDSIANSCFVCGPSNSNGLKVRFSIRDDVCLGVFTPSEDHVGYDNVTHGGIIFSLLDDVMANWLWLHDEQCFTAKADIRYYQKLPIGIEVRLEGRCLIVHRDTQMRFQCRTSQWMMLIRHTLRPLPILI